MSPGTTPPHGLHGGGILSLTATASNVCPRAHRRRAPFPHGPNDIRPLRMIKDSRVACSAQSSDGPACWKGGIFKKGFGWVLLKEGYADPRYPGRSFRRRAATRAASIGKTKPEAKTLGRRDSERFQAFRVILNAGLDRKAILATPCFRCGSVTPDLLCDRAWADTRISDCTGTAPYATVTARRRLQSGQGTPLASTVRSPLRGPVASFRSLSRCC